MWKKTLEESTRKLRSLSSGSLTSGSSSSIKNNNKRSASSDNDSQSQTTETSLVSPLRQLLDAVNMSILPHDLRLSSILQLCQFLDHRNRTTHDHELKEGAAFILFQKLAFAVSMENGIPTTNNNEHSFTHEIMLLTSCLEMVHRASPDAIAATWYDIGEDILNLLVEVLERPYRVNVMKKNSISSVTQNPSSMHRDVKLSVQKVTKLLAMYSLVPEAKYSIVSCPGMLSVLVKILDTRHLHRARTTTMITMGRTIIQTEAARFHTLATLTNLAASQECRADMLQTPGLVDMIARVVSNERSVVARQCSALGLMNLSNGDKHHVPSMASDLLLQVLVELLEDDHSETRRNAAVALYNIACADENSERVVKYKEGVLLEALLEILWHDESCSNAAETLFNMSCSDNPDTTLRMAHHPGLLDTLAEVLQPHSNVPMDVKMYCAAILRRMAELIHAPMVSQGQLLSALCKAAATWTRTADIAEALEAHADLVHNRKSMSDHVGILNALADMCNSPNVKISMPAVGTLERLSREPSARQQLAAHEGIMLALTQANYEGNGDQGQGRLVQLALKNLVDAME